ncbi:uncharacterized protein LOC131018729 [Salvia miltiorrhiza]|uniref:uncharacterized protein LOC131018729 n=1 Tax=Salvia miltiorrhiza TaxID=226208 RepID=UPI0025AD19AF|nr:uncharacterized protein LOC131018729 [Salvia miltiorrhiza]
MEEFLVIARSMQATLTSMNDRLGNDKSANVINAGVQTEWSHTVVIDEADVPDDVCRDDIPPPKGNAFDLGADNIHREPTPEPSCSQVDAHRNECLALVTTSEPTDKVDEMVEKEVIDVELVRDLPSPKAQRKSKRKKAAPAPVFSSTDDPYPMRLASNEWIDKFRVWYEENVENPR